MKTRWLTTTAICGSLAGWSHAWATQHHIPHGQGKRRAENRARRSARS